MTPETKYTPSGDVFIAYQVTGQGPVDIVLAPGFISHLEHMWEEPRCARFFHGLGSFARLIRFDKRGTGLSDRGVGFPTMEERIDDIRAVMQAAGSARAVLMGMSEGGAMCELFAATYPEKVSALVLLGTYAHAATAVPEYADPDVQAAAILRDWGTGATLPGFAPGLARDEAFRAWWARFERLSASPSAVIQLRRMNAEIDVRPILSSIQAPTLVMHRTGDVRVRVEAARELAATIAGARLIELPGEDHFLWLDDTGTVMSAIRDFIGATQAPVEPDRMLATVLFTDIVDSTRRASELGDAQWRSVIDAHNSLARNELRRFRGREVKMLGDGLLATFDGPARAVRCAQAISTDVRGLGIAIRAGVHTGEIEVVDDDDVGGIAVSIAARVSQLAGGNEVLVSSTVKDLVAGSGLAFTDLGPNPIKGLDDPLRIYRLSA
ncbi:MAG: adenylate/guanylate cyclase domain-containing protein [Alphaproteobacteria bacterium]|nr:adenylate/guanylate cyclase domain-containing protein [Alphaproteobacteria bacterium]